MKKKNRKHKDRKIYIINIVKINENGLLRATFEKKIVNLQVEVVELNKL